MSAWRIIMKNLCDIGGGPAMRAEFDPMDTSLGDGDYPIKRSKDLGLMVSFRRGYRWYFEATPLGWDWHTGRVQIDEPSNGRAGRSKNRPVATWLRALPRAGEIAL